MKRLQFKDTEKLLSPFVWIIFSTLAIFLTFRGGLVAWYWPRVVATDEPSRVFLTGLRMDIQLISYLLVPVLLLWLPSGMGLRPGRWAMLLMRGWYCLVMVVVVFMEVATPAFLSEYGVRPNRLFFEYLLYYHEVFGMLWAEYRTLLLLGVLLISVAGLAAWRFSSRFLQACPQNSFLRRLLLFPLIAALVVLGARSSLGHRPANISCAAFTNDPLVNDLALNSTYSLLFAIYQLKDEKDSSRLYGRLPEKETLRLVTSATGYPENAFTDPTGPTWHYQPASVERKSPLNLVIILEESLGAQFVENLGGLPLTPELTQLSREGLWFEELYATGTRSVRGIEAVLTGYPPSSGRSIVKLASRGKTFYNLAAHLKSLGYQSLFVYGGESHFDNMRGFFMANGFDRVVDEKDYDQYTFKGTWGVCDEDLFNRAHREFEAYGNQPFFGLVFTSSYHSPFEFPSGRLKKEELSDNPEHNAVRYADYALGRFFEQARRSSYWNNTLFLVVADHDNRVRGAELVPISHFHIPGLIIGPGIRPAVHKAVVSQIDLPPTLLSLMGISGSHPMIGRDITRLQADEQGRAIMQYNQNMAYRIGDQITILQPGQAPRQFSYLDGALFPASQDPSMAKEALAHALWPMQAYHEGYYLMRHSRGS
ncbi:hypothetical protein DSCO28_38990 [Desulfosarcina ovata subsp. sediminis]|uniref:Sulfatase N-terminal domain-containing protein n=1 Tax=Desulfosarcina ovata subsp. sediminis TaxID=885957 RepID=A0A5K7ZSZ6_9BACT|nr:LTA synthase family protein [Desulfosarcina ovata]BBO83333.1 hypothetical protein DSCO28_38990 [Desulfosarcina ovata subsp. sediminis]